MVIARNIARLISTVSAYTCAYLGEFISAGGTGGKQEAGQSERGGRSDGRSGRKEGLVGRQKEGRLWKERENVSGVEQDEKTGEEGKKISEGRRWGNRKREQNAK